MRTRLEGGMKRIKRFAQNVFEVVICLWVAHSAIEEM